MIELNYLLELVEGQHLNAIPSYGSVKRNEKLRRELQYRNQSTKKLITELENVRKIMCTKQIREVHEFYNKLSRVNTEYHPADTYVFETSSGRLKKIKTSYDQTIRPHHVWQKTSDLRRLEDTGLMSS